MRPEDWVQKFAEELGQDVPTEEEFNAILDLAAVAAHSSERTAAPVAAWLVGRSGRSLEEAQKLADSVSN
jgi:hypothetical protein